MAKAHDDQLTLDAWPRLDAGGRRSGLAYQPALDGIRALAIIGVLLYHGGVSWGQGGFLGVEAFFVLSGFLITSLLVEEWVQQRTIHLAQFWARRARRLLPALFALVAVIGIYQAIGGASKAVPNLLADGLATLAYIGNWHQIWTGSGYFAQVARPSPLQHTWSLAIEEQFYLVWPLVVLGVFALVARWRGVARLGDPAGVNPNGVNPADREAARQGARRSAVRLLFGLAIAGAIASALEMAWLFHGGSGVDRVYYGTDTRAQGLLSGAALAFGLALWRRRAGHGDRHGDPPPTGRRVLGALGILGAGGVALGMHLAAESGGTGGGLYRGGFLAFDAAAVALIASAALAPTMPVGRVLATWPLRSIGQISYGLYLWHYPMFLWLDEQTTGLAGASLFWLRVSATLGVSIVSYFAIEQPIRHRRWPSWIVRALAVPGAAGAVVALVVASSVPAAAGSGLSPTGISPGSAISAGSIHFPTSAGPTTTIPAPPGAVNWAGVQPACKVQLPTPMPALGTFHTCPPVRVMMLGDSMGVTLAQGFVAIQQQYGVMVADDAQLGCSFGVRGLGDWSGTGYQVQFAPCLTQFQTWRSQEQAWHPQALIVLMGYWDCFDRLWNGQDAHIGQAAFDSYLWSRMVQFVQDDDAGGVPILLMTVPWVDPAPFADGSPPLSASAQRHALINQMLVKLAARFPTHVHLIDTDTYVSPGNHYDADVNGHPCRWYDGIHFLNYCGELVAPHVLSLARQLVEARGGPGPSGAPKSKANG